MDWACVNLEGAANRFMAQFKSRQTVFRARRETGLETWGTMSPGLLDMWGGVMDRSHRGTDGCRD